MQAEGQRVDRGAEHRGRAEQLHRRARRAGPGPAPRPAATRAPPPRRSPARAAPPRRTACGPGSAQDLVGQLAPARPRGRARRPRPGRAAPGRAAGPPGPARRRPARLLRADGGQHQQPGAGAARGPGSAAAPPWTARRCAGRRAGAAPACVRPGRAGGPGPPRRPAAAPSPGWPARAAAGRGWPRPRAPARRRRRAARRAAAAACSPGYWPPAARAPRRTAAGTATVRSRSSGSEHGAAIPGGLGGERLGQRGLADAASPDVTSPGLPAGGRGPGLRSTPIPVAPGQPVPGLGPARRRPAGPAPGRGRRPARAGWPGAAPGSAAPGRRRARGRAAPQRLVRGQRPGLLARRGRGRHVPAVRRLVERIGGHGRFRVARRPPRVPGRQRRLGRRQPGPAQQLAHLLAGRLRPVRVRLVADRGARGQQLVRALGRGQGHRGGGAQLALGLLAEPAAASRSTTTPGPAASR